MTAAVATEQPQSMRHRWVTAPRWLPLAVRTRLPDLAALGAYLLAALAVLRRLWESPDTAAPAYNMQDRALFEWMLAHAARCVTHLENPLFTYRMNVPDGVNLIANTSLLGIGVPLTPVTLLWGPGVTYLVAVTLGLAGTSYAWYHVLSRHLVRSRLAAFVGAGFCGFMPGMLSQSQGHPQITIQFLVPFIFWLVFRLPTSVRPVRDGILLGLLVIWQAFIGEEILVTVVLVCAVCAIFYVAIRRGEALAQWRPFCTGLAVTAGVAAVVLAYPLYVQFAGAQSWANAYTITQGNPAVYWTYSLTSIAGGAKGGLSLTNSATELNANYGWPLLAVGVGIVLVLWRRFVVQLAAVVGVVFFALSLGDRIHVPGTARTIPGPWMLLSHVPVITAAILSRFGLIVGTAIGVLLALAAEEILRRPGGPLSARMVAARGVAGAALVLSLVPLIPVAERVTHPYPIPQFLAGGSWHKYVGEDQAVMVVPVGWSSIRVSMTWAAQEGLGFRLTHGYFLAPKPGGHERGSSSKDLLTPTENMLRTIGDTGQSPTITDADRDQVRATVRLRNAAILILPEHWRFADALRATVTDLLGPPQQVEGVWLWDTRALLAE